MNSKLLNDLFTPQIADACLQLKVPYRVAPAGIKPIFPSKIFGKALPVRHYGSVDVFLEVMNNAKENDILVIDNNGRMDEGCIGDLTVLEAKAHGVKGVILWGLHRDTKELHEIQVPTFTYGSIPTGPQRLDKKEDEIFKSAKFGDFRVTKDDFVFADDDGVIFIEEKDLENVIKVAQEIRKKEIEQANKIKNGETLIDQLEFNDY